MKIAFLGTADGIPRPGHFCTSTMIEVKGAIHLIDADAPVTDLLLGHGKEFKDIKAIFNTHGHRDRLNGILPLLLIQREREQELMPCSLFCCNM